MPLEPRSPDSPHAWLRHARSDLFIAENLLKETLLEDHCFHAQQCVEKSLKAVCIQRIIRFPYTHDLAELATIVFEGINGTPPPIPSTAKSVGFSAYPLRSRSLTPIDLPHKSYIVTS